MRHIDKKILFRGAGKSTPKPKPALLNPPSIGNFKIASSYSVAEIIDLVSDGPIEGLVDQNGKVLDKDIFKGIYLDNTPIQNTEKTNQNDVIGAFYMSVLGEFAEPWTTNTGLLHFSNYGDAFLIAINFYLKGLQSGSSTFYSYLKKSHYDFLNKLTSVAGNIVNSWDIGMANGDMPWFINYATLYHNSTNLIESSLFINFENSMKNIIASSYDSFKKEIAQDNFDNLNNFRKKIILNKHVSNLKFDDPMINHAQSDLFYCYLIIPFNDLQASQDVSGNVDIPPSFQKSIADYKLSYSIDLLNTEYSDSLDQGYGLDIEYFLQPEIDDNNYYTGKLNGFIAISIPIKKYRYEKTFVENFRFFNPNFLLAMRNGEFALNIRKGSNAIINENELFNFTNISAEFKRGEEFQTSLNNFDKILNDYFHETKLFGPFNKTQSIQRIDPSRNKGVFSQGSAALINSNNSLTVAHNAVIAGLEGSLDNRTTSTTDTVALKNYSDWNDGNQSNDLNASAVTHVIENPLTEEISVSVMINNLSDTLNFSMEGLASIPEGKLSAGSKIPTTAILQIETGKINNGDRSEVSIYNYLVIGLIESPYVIDFGGNYEDPNQSIKETVKLIRSEGDELSDYLNKPFPLPPLRNQENPTSTKRYVKVTKLSAETNSVLINKEMSLLKVTEIINQKLSYPFSSVVGLKLDARSFNSIPERSYDCRLKKVKIPSNYFPLRSFGEDKRYVKTASTYASREAIYIGDWDGEFQEGWTDNPAWILYDLITSQRYGLGSYIDESQINKWELYKIARFCDAVDDFGFFVGVSDGVGGLEPRFSCNIIFKEATKVYDAINVVASLFRGIVFFGNAEINFLDDRPRTPIAMFSNSNIKDGLFNYSNTQRDMQFNTVEVAYIDRFDNYKTKVEYITDEQDIRKRGVFKTTINTLGVTSRAMARRIGQHIIYQTVKENQSISFQTGLEALLCRPGDLIVIEDEMKTRSSNFGRVLSVDNQAKTVRIDTPYFSGDYAGTITLYTPTGYSTSEDLFEKANKLRKRVNEFSITGNFMNDASFNILTGLYRFSGYTQGIVNGPVIDQVSVYPEETPLYTGQSTSHGQKLFCYYNSGATGFVFATGKAFQDNDTYDKIITNTGVFYGVDISNAFVGNSGNYTGFAYGSASSNKRTSNSGQLSGAIEWNSNRNPLTDGILDEEINTYNISQIAKISITAHNNLDYGSLIYLNPSDPNTNLLSVVKQGSLYRLERKSASDQLYKIITIREDSQNDYSIVASKYNTGKYEEIEKFITEDFLPNTFNNNINVNNVNVKELDAPIFAEFGANQQINGKFDLTGRWRSTGDGVTGYRVSASNSLAGVFINQITTPTQTGILITGQTDIGNWTLAVAALGNNSTRINSLTSTTGTFIAYSGSSTTTIGKPAITKFSLD